MKSVLASLLIAGSVAFTPSGQAGTHTWTGGSTDGRWSVGANWVGGNPPVANESPLHLVFPSSATRRLATNNIANITIDSIAFGGAAYTLAASGAGTNVTFNSSVGHTYWNVLATNGTGHTFHYSMNLALDGNLELNIATNCTVTIRSRLSAASANSGLHKDGPGTVSLDPLEDNTFDGATTIVDGTLRLKGSHTQFGFTVPDVTVPGPLIIGGPSLSQNPVCLVWQANQIADNAPVTVNRNGELLFADVNDTIGSLTMAGGLVDTANGKLTLNGNVVVQNPPSGSVSQFLGYLDLGTFGRFFTVETNAYFYMGGVLSGGAFGNAPAGVNKLGPGWMAFTGPSNTFGGDLYISAGTVSITTGKQLGAATNAASVANGGTLALGGINYGPIVNDKELNLHAGARLLAQLDSEWNGPVQLYGSGKAIIEVGVNDTLEIGGVISGTGGFTKAGPGELILSGFEDNVFTGVACVEDGLMTLSKLGPITNAIAISGPLTVGSEDDAKAPLVHLTQDEVIAATVPIVVNPNAELHLLDHDQTMGSLAVNGGLVASGTFGAIKLAGNLTSTNNLPHYGHIHGRLELGNTPRSIYVTGNGGWLRIFAVISGGPAASLTKGGDSNLELYGANTYQGFTHINQSAIVVYHPGALGSPAAGTVVADWGSLFLNSGPFDQPAMTVTGEALWLSGDGGPGHGGALASFGTNVWDGVVSLPYAVVVRTASSHDKLILARHIEGPGSLTKIGPGQLIFGGLGILPMDNTYSGATIVKDGELLLAKDSFLGHDVALAGNLIIQPGGPGQFPTVRVQGRQQFLGTNAVTIYPGGWLRIDSPSTYNTIGSLAGHGVVEFAPGTRLVTGLNHQNTTFAGTIQGGGVNDTNLVKYGTGVLTLTGANGLSSRVHVGEGTLRVDSTQPIGRYDVTAPGTLGGVGSIYNVTMRGGALAPGSPLGKLKAGSFSIAASHSMQIELNGPALGTGYDQFEVDAAPDLNSTTLGTSFGYGFNPALGQEFLILRNNSGSPVIGHLEGLAEGASFNVDSTHRVQITYLGGDGNDVVLKSVAAPGQSKSISTDGNRVYVNGCGTPGATYHVEATTTIADPASWVKLGNVIAGPDGLMQYVDTDMALYPHRFYRFVTP